MEAGTTLAHYRVLRKLGAGGMGEVWLAEDTRLSRPVALKILTPEMAADADRLKRFLHEARAASALSHPNAAHIYDIGEEQGVHFLAMEYIDGETLEARLSGGAPLPLAELVSFGAQVAEALEAAHARGIIHRDIKPANIMITPPDRVKVLDFGLAKYVPVAQSAPSQIDTRLLTSDGVVLGTVQYMSPEQALGHAVDARSDLFSLGGVLYQMATGRLPFGGKNAQETIARILNSAPEAIARFNYAIPDALDRVVRKCLEKDRESRYQSARDLRIDLRGLERERPAPAAPAPAVLRAVIVDDEELARKLLREYLSKSAGIEVVAECANGFEAVKSIGEIKPDLVFLDVQMPKLDGFEVLQLIEPNVAVVFVTAYDQYAMRAFDAHAVDYLLKPFGRPRLEKALERARQRLGERMPPAAELAQAARAPETYLDRIVVKDGTRVHIIPTGRLDYVEAQDDYIGLHSEKKTYLKQQTISSIEEALDPKKFVRVHRSYIVNLERIARIEPYTKDSRVAVLSDGTQLPVSRSGHAKLKEALGES
jgi:two-component system LytT family response regulator